MKLPMLLAEGVGRKVIFLTRERKWANKKDKTLTK
jgi:hypothetical protein